MSDIDFVRGHGTTNRYTNLGCRCDACKAAKSTYDRAWRLARKGTTPPKHGEVGYRIYACRCEICAAGHATQRRRDRRNRARLLRAVPELITPGARAYLNGYCRCDVCRTDRDVRYRGKPRAALRD